MRKFTKVIFWLAGMADAVTIGICAFLMFQYWIEGDIPNALLALIATGVWCISCKVYEIHAILAKGDSHEY